MANETETRRNAPLLAGWVLLLLAFLTGFLFFIVQFPGQGALPWINLLLIAGALASCAVGLRRAFGQPQVYRGKVSGSILMVLVVLLAGLSVFGAFSARSMPGSAAAPQVGQKVPDFTLPGTDGKPVALSSLLSGPLAGAPGGHPKAVLLVFYRGYW